MKSQHFVSLYFRILIKLLTDDRIQGFLPCAGKNSHMLSDFRKFMKVRISRIRHGP